MLNYRLTRLAESDLYDIWAYIAEDNPLAADRVFEYLHELCNNLAQSPKIGKLRKDLAPTLWVFPVGKAQWRTKFSIFYRITGDGIEIARVIEGHRDISPEFFEH